MAFPSNSFLSRAPSLGRIPPSPIQYVLRNLIQFILDVYDHLSSIITQNATIEDWIAPTLLNSWVNFGGALSAAGYCKDEMGVVRLKGNVKSGTPGAASVAFTLPTGYRPSEQMIFAADGNGAHATIHIETDGDVVIVVGSGTRTSLDGITFRV